ncbi:hypothetical protein [Desertibacillus haloalkaliphilus]|nr:hypothetical protein [Desertibacillus haloalkaliphilus]MBU8908183.1 hypothetical protein [Desertibacillus haloalkaliphilus]
MPNMSKLIRKINCADSDYQIFTLLDRLSEKQLKALFLSYIATHKGME